MTIVHVFVYDYDRDLASVLVEEGSSAWPEVMEINELWERCEGVGTRAQFRDDLQGQALVIIQDGEHRCTSASL